MHWEYISVRLGMGEARMLNSIESSKLILMFNSSPFYIWNTNLVPDAELTHMEGIKHEMVQHLLKLLGLTTFIVQLVAAI